MQLRGDLKTIFAQKYIFDDATNGVLQAVKYGGNHSLKSSERAWTVSIASKGYPKLPIGFNGSYNGFGDPLVLPASNSPAAKSLGVPVPLECLELNVPRLLDIC